MQRSLLNLLLPLLIFASCRPQEALHAPIRSFANLPTLDQEIKDGDIVLRCGRDLTSEMMRQMNAGDRRFSHCGLMFTIDGKKMVFHSIGGEENPGSALRLEPLEQFFDTRKNLAAGYARMQLSEQERKKLKALLDSLFARKVPFDLSFDLHTDEALYCSEMVAKALLKVDESILVPRTDTFGHSFYSVQNIMENSRVKAVGYIKY